MRGNFHVVICVLLRTTLASVLSFDLRPGLPKLAAQGEDPVIILCAEDDHEGVIRAAQDLALDFGRVVGVNGTVVHELDRKAPRHDAVIIVGTIGKSSVIDRLVVQRKLDVSEIEGRWESYAHHIVDNPANGVSHALVIAGSDKRGSIYGIYGVSETIGVSPWHYWASIPVKTKTGVFVDPSKAKVQGPPTVKYRGIFINDEWELIGWSKGRFPQSPGSGTYFTHEFYSLVFELLLRLKANLLWPAMKNGTAFYADDPLNGQVADSYGIVIGTSHHEPMALSYDEQSDLEGPWDWQDNEREIREFMRNGTRRAKNWETMWTMGMRGEGDRESPTLTAPQLEEIIKVQREILTEETGQNVNNIPQTWSLYKEVGQYWEAGMDISENVTLTWADDNFGNILRIPLANETNRGGGHGMYYHFGYVGDPRSYNWISTTQMVKTWEQMHLAYGRGVKEIWIANVQDIKPHELSIEHFLDMAYDMSRFQSPESTTDWLKSFAMRDFRASADVADTIAEIVNIYGRLVVRRKYETLNMRPFAFSVLHYEEALSVLDEWNRLANLAKDAHNALDQSLQDAFWQLFVYPALAGKHVFEVYIAAELGYLHKEQGRASTNARSLQAIKAFADDAGEEERYNSLLDGQWEPFVSHARMGYEGRHESGPLPYGENALPPLAWTGDLTGDSPAVGVAVPGFNTSSIYTEGPIRLRPIERYAPDTEVAYIEVFAAVNGTFPYKVESNSSYVELSQPFGTLESPGDVDQSDARCTVKVDWENAPEGLSWAALNVSSGDYDIAEIIVSVNNNAIPPTFKTGFIESNGVVSIQASHWSSMEEKNGCSYVKLPWYGKTSSGVKLWPVTIDSQEPSSGPKLTYDFYTFSNIQNASLVVYLGGSLDHDPTRPLKLAYSLDYGEPEEVRVFDDYPAGEHPPDWDTAVITGGWNTTSSLGIGSGGHTLNLWLLEPGVVVEKIVLDLGGMERSALGPPESRFIGSQDSP